MHLSEEYFIPIKNDTVAVRQLHLSFSSTATFPYGGRGGGGTTTNKALRMCLHIM